MNAPGTHGATATRALSATLLSEKAPTTTTCNTGANPRKLDERSPTARAPHRSAELITFVLASNPSAPILNEAKITHHLRPFVEPVFCRSTTELVSDVIRGRVPAMATTYSNLATPLACTIRTGLEAFQSKIPLRLHAPASHDVVSVSGRSL